MPEPYRPHLVSVLAIGLLSTACAHSTPVVAEMPSSASSACGVLVATPATMLAAITTTVDSPAVPGDSDGTCSQCLADTDADSSGAEATVEIYFEDDGQDFVGDFNLTLTLDDQQIRTTSIDDASIDHEQTERFTVDDGADWDWNDVESVVVTAAPD